MADAPQRTGRKLEGRKRLRRAAALTEPQHAVPAEALFDVVPPCPPRDTVVGNAELVAAIGRQLANPRTLLAASSTCSLWRSVIEGSHELQLWWRLTKQRWRDLRNVEPASLGLTSTAQHKSFYARRAALEQPCPEVRMRDASSLHFLVQVRVLVPCAACHVCAIDVSSLRGTHRFAAQRVQPRAANPPHHRAHVRGALRRPFVPGRPGGLLLADAAALPFAPLARGQRGKLIRDLGDGRARLRRSRVPAAAALPHVDRAGRADDGRR